MKQFEGGRCLVANQVIDQMVAMSAADVDGVLAVRGYDAETGALRRGYERSILAEMEEDGLSVRLVLDVLPDASIVETVERVQKAVKREIEAMLGLPCKRVDVVVA